MSMLGNQVDSLRLMAKLVRDYDYKEISRMLREAADTIESMRDKLLKAERACDEKSYDAGFDNGMKATLQQLDGLIASGYDLKAVCAWIDHQWDEEVV